MDGPTLGLIGAIIGCTLGVAGGAVGLWHGLCQARSAAERRCLLLWSVACCAGVAALLAALAFLPDPYRWLAFLPCSLALGWATRKSGSDLARIRDSEGR